jgi:hypothetical protein
LTLEHDEDLIGVLGPGEWTTALVSAVAKPPDRRDQLSTLAKSLISLREARSGLKIGLVAR